jgi:hypothetical protein
MREEGYYWIKLSVGYHWEVDYYRRHRFCVTEQSFTYGESDIYIINEERLTAPATRDK